MWRRGKSVGEGGGGGLQAYGARIAEWVQGRCKTSVCVVYVGVWCMCGYGVCVCMCAWVWCMCGCGVCVGGVCVGVVCEKQYVMPYNKGLHFSSRGHMQSKKI